MPKFQPKITILLVTLTFLVTLGLAISLQGVLVYVLSGGFRNAYNNAKNT